MSDADGEGPSLAALALDGDVTMSGDAGDSADTPVVGNSGAGAEDTDTAALEDPLDATSSRDPDAAMGDVQPSPSGPTPSRTSRRKAVLKTQPVAGPSTPTPAPKARTGRRSVTFVPEPEAAPVVAVSPEKAAADEVLAWRSAQLDAKQAELAAIVDTHDDHVRELFHLDRFVTLIGFDPAVAKADKSDVFLSFQYDYDLFINATPGGDSAGSSRRTTRRSATERKGVLAPTDASPVASGSGTRKGATAAKVDVKGKGRADASPAIKKDEPTGHRKGARAKQATDGAPASVKSRSKKRAVAPLVRAPVPSTSKHPRPLSPASSAKRLKLLTDAYDPNALVYTHHLQIPPPPRFGASLPTFLSSYLDLADEVPPPLKPGVEPPPHFFKPDPIPTDEMLEAQARHDAAIMTEVIAFRATGRVLGNPNRKPSSEPKRSKDHRDHLIEHVVHFSKLLSDERKSHMFLSKKVGRMVMGHFDKLLGRSERERKEEEKNQKILAKWTMKEVRKKWKMAIDVVRSRNKALIKAEQDRLGKLQLNAMLDKSTTMLQAQKVEMAADSSSEEDENSEEDSQREGSEEEEEEEGEVEEEVATPEPITNVRRQRLVRTTSARDSSSSSTPIDLEEPADDDVVFEAPEDDARAGEDQAMEDEMEAEEDDDDDSELGGLADDADIPIEELMRRNGYGAVLAQVDDEDTAMDTTAEVPSSSASAVEEAPPTVEEVEAEAMSEFGSGSDDDRDGEDDQFDEDMDGNDDGAVSDDSEIDGLAEDADLPIEELMRKYGRAPETNGIHVNGDDPSSVAEDIEEEEAEEEEEVEEEAEEEVEEMEETAVAVPERVNLRPPFLLRGSLRPYQQAGLEWLAGLYSTGVNGILADEMGLGKTIQTISLLAHLACDKGQWGPHLVVVPTSVMLNWEMEFKKFLPGFKILTYYGSQKERKEKRRGWNTENAFHVCVTSYQLVLADQHMFRRKPWHYMILDEAHHIKNFRSQRWQTLLGFNARHRLLLTGTPLQNNLMELWSLLYFLMPHGLTSDGKGPFADHSDFQAWFSNPMERAIENGEAMDDETKATVAKLHTVLRPYLLRRLKAEVETQMPGKTESIIYCRLSKRQRFLYDDFMSRSQTRETLGSGHFLSIINCLMQLRKVCNHPDLFEVRPIVTSFAMARSVATEYEPAELLVRKRLLDNEPVSKMDWSSLTLLKPDSETSASSIAASRRVLWDAAAQLPSLQDLPLGMDLDVEPVHDTKTIAGWKQYNTWSQARQTKDRLDRMALTNTRRCANAVPFFGHELLHTLSTPSRQHALLPVDVARDPRTSFESSTILPTLVKSFVSRAEQGDELVARFGCVTPKVKAADMPRHALSGLSLAQAEAIEVEAPIEILHRASTKLSVAFPDRSLLQYDCGKLQKLDELLRECKAGGHRVLIFTQMTKVLDILEIFLSFHGHRYLRLDGSTKIEQRQIITERFNSNDRILCFISSTRSGGLGINLQGADTVIFYDSDWNPALDRQCQDRAHRIGQTREVRIWRFVTEHSIEENMLKKANQKRRLDEMVIAEGDFTTDYLQKLDWRDYLDDGQLADLGVDGEGAAPQAESAADIRNALAAAEDEEDAAAAKAAEGELDVDQSDFTEAVPIVGGTGSGEATPQGTAEVAMEEEGEVDPLAGTIDGYMLGFVEQNLDLF